MNRTVSRGAAASLFLALTLLSTAGAANAQTQLFEVEKSDATKLLQVGEDAGLVVRGALNAGTIPATGAGVRLMWYPGKAAFRTGLAEASQWDDANVGYMSSAFGLSATASGEYSLAMGNTTFAQGQASLSAGHFTAASGFAAVALGEETRANGRSSLAAGIRTVADGDFSTALGSLSQATGNYALATGIKTVAAGPYSFAAGEETRAGGFNAFAAGVRTQANGDGSTALGDLSQATGKNALATGFQTQATGNAATAMGTGTIAAGGASVAMGSGVTAQGNGSFIFGDGSTEYQLAAPANTFMVRAFGGIAFNTGVSIGCDLPAGTGAWACTSSRLAKEGFEDVDGEQVLARLAGIPIQRWRYVGTDALHLGPTAEDFQAAFALGESSTKIAAVDADGIALKAVQALERRTAELREENSALRAELTTLRIKLEALAAHGGP